MEVLAVMYFIPTVITKIPEIRNDSVKNGFEEFVAEFSDNVRHRQDWMDKRLEPSPPRFFGVGISFWLRDFLIIAYFYLYKENE